MFCMFRCCMLSADLLRYLNLFAYLRCLFAYSYTKHVWRYVRLLERNGVTPILVFDGQNLKAKFEETDKRER
jgi:hypothetical protein